MRDIALGASGCSTRSSAAPASFPPRPASCSYRPRATGPIPGRRRPARTAIAGRCTPSASARCRTRARRLSTRPTAISPASAALRSNTPLQALTTLNEPVFLECARALARRALRGRRAAPTQNGSTYAFRRCLAPAHRPRKRRAVLLELLAAQASGSPRAGLNPWSLPPATNQCPDIAGRCLARRARRLDRRVPGPAEPRRNDHQGMSHARHEPPEHILNELRTDVDAPLVLQAMRRRPGHRCASTSCWAGMPPPDRRLRPDPLGTQIAALSPPRPSA